MLDKVRINKLRDIYGDQKVLSMIHNQLESIPQGFDTSSNIDSMNKIIERSVLFDRCLVETDPSFQQVIFSVILKYNNKYLVMKSNKYSAREDNRYNLGIYTHAYDNYNPQLYEGQIANIMLEEEIKSYGKIKYIGTVRDKFNSNYNDHVLFVFESELASRPLVKNGIWMDRAALKKDYFKFNVVSHMMINYITKH